MDVGVTDLARTCDTHDLDLTRITLPSDEAPFLLRLLDGYGISAGRMYTGAEGVVLYLEERRELWS